MRRILLIRIKPGGFNKTCSGDSSLVVSSRSCFPLARQPASLTFAWGSLTCTTGDLGWDNSFVLDFVFVSLFPLHKQHPELIGVFVRVHIEQIEISGTCVLALQYCIWCLSFLLLIIWIKCWFSLDQRAVVLVQNIRPIRYDYCWSYGEKKENLWYLDHCGVGLFQCIEDTFK